MAPASGAGQPFRLSMLIHDRHYRALLIQALVFILVMSLAAWLVNNTVQNLARMGKTFDFGFLGQRAQTQRQRCAVDLPPQFAEFGQRHEVAKRHDAAGFVDDPDQRRALVARFDLSQ